MSSKRLPFTQGVEIELQIVDQSGSLLQGQRLIKLWNYLLKRAEAVMQKTVLDGAPSIVKDKFIRLRRVEKARQGRKLPYISVSYRMPGGKTVEIYAFGPDPNISQITWILELVTPPCETMEELGWWINSLYRVALNSLPSGFGIISIGFNPKEAEYRSGVTFGDHYHIGLANTKDRLAAYNLLRCFLPHLVALSVNSPFINEAPTGSVKIKKAPKVFVLSQNSVRSLRLKFNRGQTGPADKDHYIPYLERLDRKLFDRVVNREPPDDRYVDMFPFTDYGTIEIRVFDSQFSVSRRLALVAIIQALAYKAVKLAKSGQKLPVVNSDVLVNTRDKAIEFGLFGKFFGDERLTSSSKWFAKYYNLNPDSEKPNTKLFEAVQSMLRFIQREVDELGFQGYLKPVLTSVMGSRQLQPPCSPADYLLYIYQSSGADFRRVTSNLVKLTENFCTNITEDPIIKLFGTPEVPAMETIAERAPTVTPVAAPVISVQGSASVGKNLVVAEEQIPFKLSLTSKSSSEVRVTVLGKVLSRQGGEDNVISTAVKEVSLKPGRESLLRENTIHLSITFGTFSKPKTCFLQFTVRDEKKNELTQIKTNTFKVVATPEITVNSSPDYKKFKEGETYEIGFTVTNKTPQFSGRYQTRVYRRLPSGVSKLELEKNITSAKTGKIPYKLKVTGEIAKEPYVKIRAQVLYKGRVVGEHETPNITIIPKAIPAPEPPKPKVQVIARLPSQIQPQQATRKVKPQSFKVLPQPRPQRVQPKAPFKPQPRPQPQKLKKADKAKLKLKVVTPTVKPTAPKKVKADKKATKPAVSARVSRKAPASRTKITTASKSAAKRIVKPKPRASKRRVQPVQRKSITAKKVKATTAARRAVATTPAAGKRLRESKAVRFSVVERPKVSLYVNPRDKELVLGSGCNFDIEVKNLNPSMAGNYWLNLYYCREGGVEILVNHRMFKLLDKKKIKYKYKMNDLPKTRSFRLRADVLYQGMVIQKLESREISVKSPSINKIVKLRGVLNTPTSIMSGVRIVPFLQVNANYVLNPVTLFVNLDVSSGDVIIQKDVYSYTIRENGTYLLPLPMRIRDIPPNTKKAMLEVTLSVGNVRIGTKKTSLPVVQYTSLVEVTPPLLQGIIRAGETVTQLLRIRNNSGKNLLVAIDFNLLPLGSKETRVGKTSLKLTPREQGQIEDRFTLPLYTAGRECFLFAKISYSLKEGNAEEWIASPKFLVSQPTITLLEASIKGAPRIPSIASSGEKVDFKVSVRQKYQSKGLKLHVYAMGQEGEVKIKSINIKQKKEMKAYGSYSWRVPKVPYRTRYLLDVRVTEDGQPVSNRLIKKEKVEIIAVP
ncbi:MAG: glutamate-cysteine ligase family protein [Candidatus Lokiarchaeia archaeon]